jgi:hypothetical protein
MLGSYPSTFGEIDSLGFSKLSSSIAAIARLKGLRTARQWMGNLKVDRRSKNPRALTPESVNNIVKYHKSR